MWPAVGSIWGWLYSIYIYINVYSMAQTKAIIRPGPEDIFQLTEKRCTPFRPAMYMRASYICHRGPIHLGVIAPPWASKNHQKSSKIPWCRWANPMIFGVLCCSPPRNHHSSSFLRHQIAGNHAHAQEEGIT